MRSGSPRSGKSAAAAAIGVSPDDSPQWVSRWACAPKTFPNGVFRWSQTSRPGPGKPQTRKESASTAERKFPGAMRALRRLEREGCNPCRLSYKKIMLLFADRWEGAKASRDAVMKARQRLRQEREKEQHRRQLRLAV
jgi:hypothetical protein